MMFDSIIASITGLDQSKYAEYEPNPEECGQSDLKVPACTTYSIMQACTKMDAA